MRYEVYVYDPTKGRKVHAGAIVDKAYRRFVRAPHKLYYNDSYCIQDDIFPFLIQYGVQEILITVEATKQVFCSSVSNWSSKDVIDHGHGLQRSYPVASMVDIS